MHAWEQIQKTVDYIEDHLSENIKIEDMAKLASLSQFYYQRLFTRLVKRPVNEYIKLRRLAKVSDALKDKSSRILDIALDYGFLSHESLSRTFKESFGMTPSEYRADPVPLNNFIKPQLLMNYVLIDENVPLIADDIVLEISRRKITSAQHFIGLTAEEPIEQIPGGGNTGVDTLGILWDTFHERKSSIYELKAGGDELGVAYPGTKEGYYRYFAGAEAAASELPESYDLWELPESEYIVCSFEAEDFEHLVMDAIYKAQKYLFGTWLPGHKYNVRPFSAERYANHTPKTTTMEIWVLPDRGEENIYKQ